MNGKQISLIEQLQEMGEGDSGEIELDEWAGMPEFNMSPIKSIHTIKLNFQTIEDIKEFSKLIGQKISTNTENYWFPKINRKSFSDLKFYDDEP